jgi:menaquinone-dependent protoporphyrinogen oxidase
MMQTRLSRRQFLVLAGGTFGAATLACSRISTGSQPEPKTEWIDTTYGEKTAMKDKILIAYASQAGSTAEVADAIGKSLAVNGTSVDVRPVKEVTDLSLYKSVVVGSAIHSGNWLPEAVQFVQDHQSQLNQIPTAYFLVCMMAAKDTEESRKFVSEYLEPVRIMVKPVAEGRFAGALTLKKYSFIDGLGLRIFLAYLKLKEGDYRNWEAINAWAEQLRPQLQ